MSFSGERYSDAFDVIFKRSFQTLKFRCMIFRTEIFQIFRFSSEFADTVTLILLKQMHFLNYFSL